MEVAICHDGGGWRKPTLKRLARRNPAVIGRLLRRSAAIDQFSTRARITEKSRELSLAA
jgi:hypothetical protein